MFFFAKPGRRPGSFFEWDDGTRTRVKVHVSSTVLPVRCACMHGAAIDRDRGERMQETRMHA